MFKGSFGKVRLGTHKLTGQEVAIKVVDKIHAPSVVREIDAWRHLRHPNIVQLFEVLTTESNIYMVMELCRGGEAFEYITEKGKMDDTTLQTKRIVRQIVESVGYCHEKKDLKLENILLTRDLDVKLIDFGFTREYNGQRLLETYCGSTAYAAPEMIVGEKYSGPMADIWSLGVILYTLVCGYLPFDDDNESKIHQKILNVDLELPEFLTTDCKDLICQILQRDFKMRLTIPQILSHPWFREENLYSSLQESEESIMKTIMSRLRPEGAPLGTTPEEAKLIGLLSALGMDVEGILASVQMDICDQNSGLWYLLLQKHRALLSPQPGKTINFRPYHKRHTSNNAELDLVTADFVSKAETNVDVEKYLEGARRKSTGDGVLYTPIQVPMYTTSSGGRRGMMMEAMRNKGSSSRNRENRRPSAPLGNLVSNVGIFQIDLEEEPNTENDSSHTSSTPINVKPTTISQNDSTSIVPILSTSPRNSRFTIIRAGTIAEGEEAESEDSPISSNPVSPRQYERRKLSAATASANATDRSRPSSATVSIDPKSRTRSTSRNRSSAPATIALTSTTTTTKTSSTNTLSTTTSNSVDTNIKIHHIVSAVVSTEYQTEALSSSLPVSSKTTSSTSSLETESDMYQRGNTSLKDTSSKETGYGNRSKSKTRRRDESPAAIKGPKSKLALGLRDLVGFIKNSAPSPGEEKERFKD
ncbi:hypothetical protein HK096_001683 [Nowakowskiella sp. JEL0078]|nr:hypothetical protein HK096_001683 [Nowakowskiella sp. JEL0078]